MRKWERVKRGEKGGGLWWVSGSVKSGKKEKGLRVGKKEEGYG